MQRPDHACQISSSAICRAKSLAYHDSVRSNIVRLSSRIAVFREQFRVFYFVKFSAAPDALSAIEMRQYGRHDQAVALTPDKP